MLECTILVLKVRANTATTVVITLNYVYVSVFLCDARTRDILELISQSNSNKPSIFLSGA